jgi:hypothetical protein
MHLKDNESYASNLSIKDSILEILKEHSNDLKTKELKDKSWKEIPLCNYFLALNHLIKGGKIHVRTILNNFK